MQSDPKEEGRVIEEAVSKSPEAKVHLIYGPDIGGAEYENRFVVDSDVAKLQHEYLCEHPATIHSRVSGYFFQIFGRMMPPVELITAPGERNIIGSLDTILKLREQSIPCVWRFPETYLHPRYAVNLGDIVIDLGKEK